jgi:hypothetical protein
MNRAGELNGTSSNWQNEEETSTLSQRAEGHLLKTALKTRRSKGWAEKEIERKKKNITERASA